jgi:hypothetical protein
VKKLIGLALLFSISVLSLSAQKVRVKNDPTHDDKPLHFGFSLGLNFMDYTVYQTEEAQLGGYYVGIKNITPGINIQAIANLRLSENWDLRSLPGISFGERQLYFVKLDVRDESGSFYDSIMYDGDSYPLESSFLELPISFKYKAKRFNNFRPYFIGGVNLRYDLAVKKEYDYKEQLIMIKPLDVYLELGTGFDFYLTYFKFAIELKYSIGMTNIYSPTNRSGEYPEDFLEYSAVLDKLKAHIFSVSFHFE